MARTLEERRAYDRARKAARKANPKLFKKRWTLEQKRRAALRKAAEQERVEKLAGRFGRLCGFCADLPHRRAKPICRGCKKPFQPEEVEPQTAWLSTGDSYWDKLERENLDDYSCVTGTIRTGGGQR